MSLRAFSSNWVLFFVLTTILLFEATGAVDDDAIIPGQYIVFYAKNTDRIVANQRLFFSSGIAFSDSFQVVQELEEGIAVAGITDEQYQELLQDESVEKVIPDFRIKLDAVQNSPPNWGLDRIDQASLPLNSQYEYNYDGTGVKVFVIDTGIRGTHTQFGGRVTCGINLLGGSGCEDVQGHGTHVAGTIGGFTVGVAKNVQLVDVNVFGPYDSAEFSSILAALEYVVAEKKANPSIPMVINMSLGANGVSQEYGQAIDKAVAANIVVVVAAGNSDSDSCKFSPSFVTNAITVGASDVSDKRASFSNYGTCVDLYAPGVNILSSFIISDNSGAVASGTSMAAPHVAGAAALYLQKNPAWTPAQVWNAMKNDATRAIRRSLFPFRLFRRLRSTTRLLLQTDNI